MTKDKNKLVQNLKPALDLSSDKIIEKKHSKSNNIKLINEFGKLKFTIYDYIKDKNTTIDLHCSIYEGHPHIRWTLGELFLLVVSRGKGWSDPSTHAINGRYGSVKNQAHTIKRIGIWWVKNKPETRMSDWSLNDIRNLFSDVLMRKVVLENSEMTERLNKNYVFMSSTVIGDLKNALNRSEIEFFNGTMQDGISFKITDFHVKSWVTRILSKNNIIYKDWLRGKSYPSVPLPVAMLMLNDAIKIIRDKKTLFLIDYYQQQKPENYYPISSIFNPHESAFRNFCLGRGKLKEYYAPTRAKAQILKNLIIKHYGEKQIQFPMSHSEINHWCEKVSQSAIIIMLCLTGARISEITSMKGGSVSKSKTGLYEFKSDIIKTNLGLTTTRAVHGLAAEAAFVIEELSYLDKTKNIYDQYVPLFSYFYKPHALRIKKSIDDLKPFDIKKIKHGASTTRLGSFVKIFYSDFLERHPELNEICPNIHSHMFRHTFAEFALRRFEGNVHEAIRRHFRHSNGSFMTNRYLSNKENEAFAFAEEQMIRETAEKMIIEAHKTLKNELFEPQFFGASMKAAMDLLNIRVVSTDEELDDVITEFSESFLKMVPHEYGYCMPRKQTINQSKCFDDISKTANFEDAGFATCSSCLHSVQNINSHKAAIMQIGITHSHQMASIERSSCFSLNNNKAYQVSKKAVQESTRKIQQMEKSKIISSSKA